MKGLHLAALVGLVVMPFTAAAMRIARDGELAPEMHSSSSREHLMAHEIVRHHQGDHRR